MLKQLFFFIGLLIIPLTLSSQQFLRDQLRKAEIGDYLVTLRQKNVTLLLVRAKTKDALTIEEITTPIAILKRNWHGWREWVRQYAPGHTSWVLFQINLNQGSLTNYYSLDTHQWSHFESGCHFLSTLLNLRLSEVPVPERSRVGPAMAGSSRDSRDFWTPPLFFEGQLIRGAPFAVWETRWPKDGSEISNRKIVLYVPEQNSKYPAYFPYWLQVYGISGQAKVRVIDSGKGLVSPQPNPPNP